jgi:uncharacterized protein (DUF3084 family)
MPEDSPEPDDEVEPTASAEDPNPLDATSESLEDTDTVETDSADTAPTETDERAADLEATERRLDQREASLASREQALDERENDLRERREDLQARAEELEARREELDRREDTLREYVGQELADLEESLSATVEDSVQSAVSGLDREQPQEAVVRNLFLALVGILLVSAGVANLVAAQTPGMVRLFSSATLNVVASGVLIVLGLGANLAGVTGRV